MERLFPRARMRYLVLACAKSGTTWLQRLLSAHPEVHCSETRLMGDFLNTENPSGVHVSLEKFVSLLSRHYSPPVPPGESEGFYRTLLFNMIDTIAETTLRASGKSVYGEKLTPFLGTASQAVERLAEYNPDLRLVNLVRDGRDVIVSGFVQRANARIARGGEDADAHRAMLERRRVSGTEFEFFLGLWVAAVLAGMEASRRFPNFLDLRYETYLKDAEGQTARLLDFVGVDASSDRVRECVRAASFERLSGGRAPGQEDRANFFRKGVAGDWRNWLTPGQVDAFDRAAGPLLEACGYARR